MTVAATVPVAYTNRPTVALKMICFVLCALLITNSICRIIIVFFLCFPGIGLGTPPVGPLLQDKVPAMSSLIVENVDGIEEAYFKMPH